MTIALILATVASMVLVRSLFPSDEAELATPLILGSLILGFGFRLWHWFKVLREKGSGEANEVQWQGYCLLLAPLLMGTVAVYLKPDLTPVVRGQEMDTRTLLKISSEFAENPEMTWIQALEKARQLRWLGKKGRSLLLTHLIETGTHETIARAYRDQVKLDPERLPKFLKLATQVASNAGRRDLAEAFQKELRNRGLASDPKPSNLLVEPASSSAKTPE
jgi:hypothetical protein